MFGHHPITSCRAEANASKARTRNMLCGYSWQRSQDEWQAWVGGVHGLFIKEHRGLFHMRWREFLTIAMHSLSALLPPFSHCTYLTQPLSFQTCYENSPAYIHEKSFKHCIKPL